MELKTKHSLFSGEWDAEAITIEADFLGYVEVPEGAPSPVIASGPDNPPPPIPIFQEELIRGGFFTVGAAPDNGANTFLWFVENDAWEFAGQAAGKVLRLVPGGAVTHNWTIELGTINGVRHKADSMGGMITGDRLVVYLSSHALNEGPRIMAIWQAVIDGIVVPYPQGVRPTGKEGAFVATQGPESEVDYARIQTMIDAAVNRAQNNIVNQLQGKAQQGATLAIQGQGVVTLGNIYDSAGLFQRILETGYQAAKEGDLHAMAQYFAQNPYCTPTPPPPPGPAQPLLPQASPPSDTGGPQTGATVPSGVSIPSSL